MQHVGPSLVRAQLCLLQLLPGARLSAEVDPCS